MQNKIKADKSVIMNLREELLKSVNSLMNCYEEMREDYENYENCFMSSQSTKIKSLSHSIYEEALRNIRNYKNHVVKLQTITLEYTKAEASNENISKSIG